MTFRFKEHPLSSSTNVYAKTKFGDIVNDGGILLIPSKTLVYRYDFATRLWSHYSHNNKTPVRDDVPPTIMIDVCDNVTVTDNNFFDLLYCEDADIDNYYRFMRKQNCFSVVNRGPLWYNHLSLSQQTDLNVWYEAWLDAPETHTFPVTPYWLNDKLQKTETEEIF